MKLHVTVPQTKRPGNVMKRLFAPLLVAAISLPAFADSNADWPSFGHDPGSQRYSPVTQITPANVSKLRLAWTSQMTPAFDPKAAPSSRAPGSETTPLVINGVMYLSTPYARI